MQDGKGGPAASNDGRGQFRYGQRYITELAAEGHWEGQLGGQGAVVR